LTHAPGLHAGQLRPLLERLGSPDGILAASPAALSESGAGSLAAWLHKRPRPRDAAIQAELRWLESADHHFIPLDDEHYPPLLAELVDAPVGLFVRGDPAVLSLPQLAIVGSRNPTAGGRDNAASFATHLARCGLTITSGLAIGIDAAAHRGALDAEGYTVAVCGAGLDIDYPASNSALAAAIAAHGALVSEFPLGVPALKENFPRRNRIISGLALGTLVVEAAVRSGSLITARLAADQGREVFAIPGSIHNPMARGCHRLIRQGAQLVETADDIFTELRTLAGALAPALRAAVPEPRRTAPGTQEVSGPVLDKGYEILLDALGFEPAGVDGLVERTGLKADEVAAMLLILELDGRLESRPGGLYVRRVLKAAK
ncbi:MAG TPA: DNA-processing protein DprA, partial [Steroidobacteraceae bacterium]|nr:DNA-processing protein DprA [Steroidobacteraceae bacterium]